MSRVYHAEVVGSLLRPAYLKEARARWESGTEGMSTAGYKAVEDRAVADALALQEQVGVDVVTDGEMRRGSFLDPVFRGASGFAELPGAMMRWRPHEGGGDELEMPFPYRVTAKLERRRFVTVEEFSSARSRTALPLKVTVPGPLSVINAYVQEHSGEAYPDPFDLFADVAALVKEEVQQLAELGCEYVQIDSPEWTELCDPSHVAALAERGISSERLLSDGIDLYNSIATVPGVKFGMHLCRGSLPTHFFASGGYDAIAERVLGRATNFDVFMLEYDDERAGTFEPLAQLPQDKTVVLGLVSTKKPELETVDEISSRIEEASRFYPMGQLGVSSQCGFGSGFIFDAPPERQEAKLRLVAAVATRVWG
jgi:methionine synthase II (cobalamin-independent)